MDREGEVAAHDDQQPRDTGPCGRSAFGASPAPPPVRDQQHADDRRHRQAQDVALHRDGGPERGHDPPRDAPRRPGSPRTGEGDRTREGDQIRVPDERGSIDGRRRDRQHETGDQSGDGTADRPREPPRHGDRGDPGERDLEDDGQRRVTACQERGGGQQVVVQGAVVDIADRCRRSEEWHDPIHHE